MRSAYYPESIVRVAWFQGNGFEFVEASKGMHRQGQSKHRLSPTIVRLNGDRSLAETDTVIETRTLMETLKLTPPRTAVCSAGHAGMVVCGDWRAWTSSMKK